MKPIPLGVIRDIALSLEEYKDDEQLMWDTIDGETEAGDIVDDLLEIITDAEAMVDAVKRRETELKTRRMRLQGRVDFAKSAIIDVLNAAGVGKIERPVANVSIRKGSEVVDIVELMDIPSQLLTEKVSYAPDKDAIKAQLKAGEDVPGARLKRNGDTLQIRKS